MREPPGIIRPKRQQLKRHLRDVEDDAVGVGQREGAHIDLAAQIHDQAGRRFVAAEPDVGRDRKRVGARRRCRRSGGPRDACEDYAEESPARRPDSHRFDPFAPVLLH
jgi:hypothetical protein